MKKIYQRWIVMVHRNDGLRFEKLELDFEPEYDDETGKHIERKDTFGNIIRTPHAEVEVELTEYEASELNKQSEFNGIRYYEKE